MALFQTLRIVFSLSAVPALIAGSGASTRSADVRHRQPISRGGKIMVPALILLACGAVVSLGVGVWVLSSSLSPAGCNEAVYRGQPTSFWLARLQHHDPAFRQQAIQALQQIRPKDERVIPALAGMLKDPNQSVRLGAAFALRKLGPEAKAAAPSLVQALRDEDGFVWLHAAYALASIEPQDKSLIAARIPVLEKESRVMQQAILKLLGELGPDARVALPAVRKALEDSDAEVRHDASEALAKIGGILHTEGDQHKQTR